MSPGKGQPTERCKQTTGATVPPALRSFACKPIFRSVRSYFFLFQHVCAIRMPGSEGFRLGIRVGKRIEGVIEACFSSFLLQRVCFSAVIEESGTVFLIESRRNVVLCRYQIVFSSRSMIDWVPVGDLSRFFLLL